MNNNFQSNTLTDDKEHKILYNSDTDNRENILIHTVRKVHRIGCNALCYKEFSVSIDFFFNLYFELHTALCCVLG